MNCSEVGGLIKRLRTAEGMTQKQLADMLGVSDKAVSKWERGLGCPDITLVTELSRILSVSVDSLLAGNTEENIFREVNMKKNKYYICPKCGSITVCTGNAEISCCGIRLSAQEAVKAEGDQKLCAELTDGEWHITSDHPMTKEDYISFAAFASGERLTVIKLYPEWNLSFRLPYSHGMLLWYGEKSGLLYQNI